MSELIVPGSQRQPADVLYIVDRSGREVEVPTEDLWQFLPDATTEKHIIVDGSNLPYQSWQEGDKDE